MDKYITSLKEILMFRDILNAISSVFKKKPVEVGEVNVTVVPAETVTEAPAVAPTVAPVEEATVAPIKKKRTYTKKTGPKSAK